MDMYLDRCNNTRILHIHENNCIAKNAWYANKPKTYRHQMEASQRIIIKT